MVESAAQKRSTPLRWVRTTDPRYYINSAAISGDGNHVIAGTFFHNYSPGDIPDQLAIPDTFGTYCFGRHGKQLWKDTFVGYEGVYAVAISDNGTIATSGGWYSNDPLQGFVRAYSTKDGTQLISYLLGARINALALSADGTTLVAVADDVYLFQQSDGVFPANPSILKLNGSTQSSSVPKLAGSPGNASVPEATDTTNSAQTIAIAADGSSFVLGDALGTVYLVENNGGQIGTVSKWSDSSLTTVHSVASSSDNEWFAAVGDDGYVYVFTPSSIQQQNYAGRFLLGTGSVRGVAMSADGSHLAAIVNNDTAGVVHFLSNDQGTLTQLWTKPTLRNPNSTSLDAAAEYVSVADGYPDGTPGHFYLFNAADGSEYWRFKTDNMSWPMFLSADGSAIVAGSDNGNIYYFTPQAPQ